MYSEEHNQVCRHCNPSLQLPNECVFCGKPASNKIRVCNKCLKEAVKILDKEVA